MEKVERSPAKYENETVSYFESSHFLETGQVEDNRRDISLVTRDEYRISTNKKGSHGFRQSQFSTVESGPGITVLKLGKDGPIFKISKRRAPSQKPRAGKKIGNITW